MRARTTYRRGATGSAVAEIRARLFRLHLLADGDGDTFDEPLDRAVRAFQQERGIAVDGVVGPQTFRRLEEARWRLGDRVLAFLPAHLVVGDDVLGLQERLIGLGFSPGRPDGIFGRRTDHAVREFQLNTGLPADGTAGTETFRALARLTRPWSISGETSLQLREQQAFDVLRTGVTQKVVVLDAGPDQAAKAHQGPGMSEADIAIDIARRVEGRLAALGTTVLLTGPARRGHTSFDETARAAIANEVGADVLVSLHCDFHESPLAHGMAAFYFGVLTGRGNSVGGKHLAELLLEEIEVRNHARNCGAHPKTWELLRLTRMPAVHLDLGYLSNPDDARRLEDPASRDQIAKAITAALIRFFAPPAE
ncbi:MAG: N-acetylmuramoyl-L-alanine amidase [Candidatus Nanopelagicales bacterium]